MTDREDVAQLIASMDTVWARYLQEKMEERAAAAEYRRLGIVPTTQPYDPEEKDYDQ